MHHAFIELASSLVKATPVETIFHCTRFKLESILRAGIPSNHVVVCDNSNICRRDFDSRGVLRNRYLQPIVEINIQ